MLRRDPVDIGGLLPPPGLPVQPPGQIAREGLGAEGECQVGVEVAAELDGREAPGGHPDRHDPGRPSTLLDLAEGVGEVLGGSAAAGHARLVPGLERVAHEDPVHREVGQHLQELERWNAVEIVCDAPEGDDERLAAGSGVLDDRAPGIVEARRRGALIHRVRNSGAARGDHDARVGVLGRDVGPRAGFRIRRSPLEVTDGRETRWPGAGPEGDLTA